VNLSSEDPLSPKTWESGNALVVKLPLRVCLRQWQFLQTTLMNSAT